MRKPCCRVVSSRLFAVQPDAGRLTPQDEQNLESSSTSDPQEEHLSCIMAVAVRERRSEEYRDWHDCSAVSPCCFSRCKPVNSQSNDTKEASCSALSTSCFTKGKFSLSMLVTWAALLRHRRAPAHQGRDRHRARRGWRSIGHLVPITSPHLPMKYRD
eukprot:Sspe_Gene.85062::Locus_55882_Transcript_1_1_Confidence_1.000_Length_3039::g.85062::m.85062